MKKLLLLLFFLCGIFSAFATHNRAGEITYKHLSGFKYEITVTTYTNTFATTADRCSVVVYFGDGDSATVGRVNGLLTITCDPFRDGEMIAPNTRKNIYIVNHVYPGAGDYYLHMEDPNRNAGICNIPNSVNISFYLTSRLIINPFLPSNSSPVLLNPPLDEACVGQCFEHNPGAYDEEGDSLYYTLTTCYANGAPIFLYSYPPNMSPSSINHTNGDLVWCAPTEICQYNVAILIEEWKLVPGHPNRFLSGSILRDMQIDVFNCNTTPPVIQPINDTCIIAGTSLTFPVNASDNDGNQLILTATGGPFLLSPAATFVSTSGIGIAGGTFNWNTNCSLLQLLPYQVTFKAKDSDFPTPLVNFETVQITIIAPAITGLTAVASGSAITLNWAAPFCNALTGANPLKKYVIYRRNDCVPFLPGPCETGLPSYAGYSAIGSVNAPVTTYVDNNNGSGLTHGIEYSYIVVAVYADGSQSIASENVCERLVRDVPIITNVSVMSTGTSDSIWTHWLKPLAGADNLDTLINPPPYEYRLMRAKGMTGSLSFSAASSYNYLSYWQMTDTGFVSTGLNTQDSAYTFKIDFYSNGILKGSTQTASSIFLSSSPIDNQVNLSWQHNVPWLNYRYDIYRETSSGSGIFNFVDSTTALTYSDSGLVNNVLYCYKVISYGKYSDTTLPRPLVNRSQIKCEKPVDTTPPCQPTFAVDSDCDIPQNLISWLTAITSCNYDVVQYNIYYSPVQGSPMSLLYSTTDLSNNQFIHLHNYDGIPSIAGCYTVTSQDTAGNESLRSNVICIDNCPLYILPNVFTPNGDNVNDFFSPLPDYKFVKDVEISIYDRWGLLMFETTDPNVMWDGKNHDTGAQCTDGTYFYVCTVNEIRLAGIVPRVLKGFVQLINTGGNSNK